MNLNNIKKYLLRVINFLFFYFGWGLCLQQASINSGWLGPLVVLGMFLFHLYMIQERLFELVFVPTMAFLGSITDTVYMWSGLITYEAMPSWLNWWAPPWIFSVWVLFAMSINHSLIWMKERWWLAIIFGAGGACLTYSAGEVIGACNFHEPFPVVMMVIGSVWSFFMPLSIWYANWLKKTVGDLS